MDLHLHLLECEVAHYYVFSYLEFLKIKKWELKLVLVFYGIISYVYSMCIMYVVFQQSKALVDGVVLCHAHGDERCVTLSHHICMYFRQQVVF